MIFRIIIILHSILFNIIGFGDWFVGCAKQYFLNNHNRRLKCKWSYQRYEKRQHRISNESVELWKSIKC